MSIIRVVCVKDGIVSAQNTHKNDFFAVSLFTRGIEKPYSVELEYPE